MSGAVSSSDVEIDLGRWTHRVLSRWYIVVACVLVAIIIALIGAGGGKKRVDGPRDRERGSAVHVDELADRGVARNQPERGGHAAQAGRGHQARRRQGRPAPRPAQGGDLHAAGRPAERQGQLHAARRRDRERPVEDEGRRRREQARAAVRVPGQPVPARPPQRGADAREPGGEPAQGARHPREGRGRELPADPQGAGDDPERALRRTSRSGS